MIMKQPSHPHVTFVQEASKIPYQKSCSRFHCAGRPPIWLAKVPTEPKRKKQRAQSKHPKYSGHWVNDANSAKKRSCPESNRGCRKILR
jgi:hypothetical protein